jgi:asparagine synthase (glutamine-hydrolysing)
MCGIVGIVDLYNRVERPVIAALCQAIEHRGPDDHGIYLANSPSLSVGFGSQRLSILDLSPAGHMPMQNEAGDVTLAYNGEIYNHHELRADLQQRGFRYRSHTDTETLLHAYEAFGLDCLSRLNGMFAAAIHDRRSDRVILARDRMGIKPLYYCWDGHRLLFASELKALLGLPHVPKRINRQALDVYLSLGYVPAPLSLIEGVTSLPAGHYVELHNGELQTRAFWNEGYRVAALSERTDDELIALTRQTLEDAVRRQLMSDVPVGVLLSGGLDSTIITALAQKHHDRPLDTFAVGFASASLDGSINDDYNADRHYAALAAQRLGTRHHEVLLRDDLLLAELLRDLVRSLDEPVWEASFVSIFLLCRLAREHGVKVVLSGDGSDELFAGYSWYRGAQRLLMYERLPLLHAALPTIAHVFGRRELGKKARELQTTLHGSATVRYRANYDHFSAEEKRRLLGAASSPDPVDALLAPLLERAGGSLVEQFSFADLKLWVGEHFNQRIDRMSMACSVEARVPFQDNAVVDLALGIACARKMKGGEHKYLLRRAFADILPPEILNRPKRPFAAPQHSWLREGLRGVTGELLSPERIAAAGLLDPAAVEQVYQRYLSGEEIHPHKLSILVMFQIWCEEVLAGSSVTV